MAYKVRVEIGKGKNHAVSESIPLPNRQRVCRFIRENPMVRSNTQVRVTNLRTGKVTIGNQAKFCIRGGKNWK